MRSFGCGRRLRRCRHGLASRPLLLCLLDAPRNLLRGQPYQLDRFEPLQSILNR